MYFMQDRQYVWGTNIHTCGSPGQKSNIILLRISLALLRSSVKLPLITCHVYTGCMSPALNGILHYSASNTAMLLKYAMENNVRFLPGSATHTVLFYLRQPTDNSRRVGLQKFGYKHQPLSVTFESGQLLLLLIYHTVVQNNYGFDKYS